MKLVPKPVDDRSALSDLNESLKVDLDPAMQGFKQGLLGEKSNWEAAQKQLEVENKNLANIQGQLSAGGLDDNTLKALTQQQADTQSKIQYLQEAQKKSHENADYLRALAGRQGYDLSNYDSETNLENATLNMQADTQGIINKILNRDMTSEQYYNAAYNKLREAGATVGQAQRIAAKRAGEYKADRVAKYKTAMQMFGTNGDGTMNDAMVKLMWNIMEDSPMLAEAAAKLYATPQQQYSNNVIAEREQAARNDQLATQIALAKLNHENDLDKLLSQYIYNSKQLEQQQGYKQSNIKLQGEVNDTNNARSQERQFQYDSRKAAQAQEYDKELKVIQGQIDEALKNNDRAAALKIYEAKLALNKKYGIGSSKNEKSLKQKFEELDEAQRKYDKYLEEHPEATGSANEYYGVLTDAKDAVLGRFEGDPSNYYVAWSWITDFMEKFANDKKQKATRAAVKAFANAHFPEWIAKDIINTLEAKNYNGFTAD